MVALILSGCEPNGIAPESKPGALAPMMLAAPAPAVVAPVLAAPAAIATTPAQQFQHSYDDEAAGKLDVALADLEGIGSAGTAGYVAQLRRGWLLHRAGKYAAAVTAYNEAITLSPDSVEARVGLLYPLGELRRWADIEVKAKEVLQKDPGNQTAGIRLAYALYSLARYAEAETAYRAVLNLAPSDVDARAGLGWSQLKGGKTKSAQATFTDILAFAPKNALALEGMKSVK